MFTRMGLTTCGVDGLPGAADMGRPGLDSHLQIMLLALIGTMLCDFMVQGAAGIADILFGKTSPSGKLPVTFYYDNYTTIQTMSNMDMRSWPGRTYRSPAVHSVSCCHWLYGVLYVLVPRAVLCRAALLLCCAVLCCAVLCCAAAGLLCDACSYLLLPSMLQCLWYVVMTDGT